MPTGAWAAVPCIVKLLHLTVPGLHQVRVVTRRGRCYGNVLPNVWERGGLVTSRGIMFEWTLLGIVLSHLCQFTAPFLVIKINSWIWGLISSPSIVNHAWVHVCVVLVLNTFSVQACFRRCTITVVLYWHACTTSWFKYKIRISWYTQQQSWLRNWLGIYAVYRVGAFPILYLELHKNYATKSTC